MIKSFRDKETELIWSERFSKRFPRNMQRLFLRKLIMIHKSISLNDLIIPPSNRLEKLKGDRAGQYSIRLNDQWRICFYFKNGDAFEVEIVDYH
jgi:proteic killer suppression protein